MEFAGFAGGAAAPELDRALFGMQETEGQRYAAFFGALEQAAPRRVARATALAFFNKSALGEPEVAALYTAIKSVGMERDVGLMDETEFVMGMHLIVCLTKRGLARVPSPFPTYLFPSLALPTSTASGHAHADLISSMPSPEKPSGFGGSSGGFGDVGGSSSVGRSSFSATSSAVASTVATEIATLEGATSLVELAQKEVQNGQLVKSRLAQLDQSEAQTLQHLHATLAALAAAVAQLGFPVPPATHASLGAVDDLGNLLRANVQSLKQEIQSLEISARMRSVADEASSRTNSREQIAAAAPSATPSEASAAIAQVTALAAQLATLQHKAAQLHSRKDALARQVLDKKTAAAAAAVTSSLPPAKTVSGSAGFPSPSPSPSLSLATTAPPMSTSSTASSMGLAPPPSSWGDFSASPAAVAPLSAVRATEPPAPATDAFAFVATGSPATSADGFAFGVPASATTTAQPQADADLGGWGAFQ